MRAFAAASTLVALALAVVYVGTLSLAAAGAIYAVVAVALLAWSIWQDRNDAGLKALFAAVWPSYIILIGIGVVGGLMGEDGDLV